MPETMILRRLLLPELKLVTTWQKPGTRTVVMEADKESAVEVCPRLMIDRIFRLRRERRGSQDGRRGGCPGHAPGLSSQDRHCS